MAPTAGFRRELTPTWLSLACLLAGHRPPDLTDGFRYVHLGCGAGVTTAVVAAAHPGAQVWAWAERAEDAEATHRLARRAELANLAVHERPGLPADLGGTADVVVVDGVLPASSDERRADILAAVGAAIRPGGLVCVTYRTTVGWAEIAPVHRTLRRVAQGHTGHPDELVPSIRDLIGRLRDGGARHLTERPAVAAWIDELLHAEAADVIDLLRDEVEPLSHAQVADALAGAGATFVGSARLLDDLDHEIPAALRELVATAASPALREAYRDLAVRPSTRIDVFRRGVHPLDAGARDVLLAEIELVPLAAPADRAAAAEDTAPAGADLALAVRLAVDEGRTHPAVVGGTSPEAATASRALAAALDELGVDLLPAPAIGSALASAADAATLERVGAA